MGKPKKQSSPRKTGLRRSHLVLELARTVNARLSNAGSSVRAYTTKRESSKVKKATAAK
jgi:hypothetical protein